MFISILYTIAALADLLAFLVGVLLLPARVPIHLAGLTVDRLGSPWTLIAFPAVSAFLAIAFFPIALHAKRGRGAALCALSAVGAAFAVVGWVFFGIAAQPAVFGETIAFPYAAVSALPVGFFVAILGGFLFEREKTGRRLGVGLIASGLLSAAVAIGFSCAAVSPRLDWIASVVLVVSVLAALCFAQFSKK